jgi:hypothetical protein
VLVVTAFAVLTATGVYLAVRALTDALPLHLPLSESCRVSGEAGASAASGETGRAYPTEVDLDPDQMANAATISAVGIRRGVPQRAVVVALATALQESKLRNLGGGDRDSIGLFQQRPSQDWGTPEQLADPRYATNAFYTSLLKVRGWQQLRVTEAAQKVQRSAHPEAYEKWADEAQVLAWALGGDVTAAVACTVVEEPTERGAAAATALAQGVRLDWGEVRTVSGTGVVGLALAARDDRTGWQYAHWLVAHAEERGIRRVAFGDREWNAKGGSWVRVAAPTGGQEQSVTAGTTAVQQVVAEVYATA